jgi:hypothetical protein
VGVEPGVKGADRAVAARFLEMEVKKGGSVEGIAKSVLEAGVRLNFGIAGLELLGEPLIHYQISEELMISEQHVYRVSPASWYTSPRLARRL